MSVGFAKDALLEYAFAFVLLLPSIMLSIMTVKALGLTSSQATAGYALAAMFTLVHYERAERTLGRMFVRGVVYCCAIIAGFLTDAFVYGALKVRMPVLVSMTIALLVGMEVVAAILFATTERTVRRNILVLCLLSLPVMALIFALLTWLFSTV